ncbi:MAG: histidine kinase [Armatimonadetes bacterium]|nr:histidine kinase [Armatimonadota bacterium]
MNVNPEALDEFLKSTCVIVVFAYLLTRKPLQAIGRLGVLFGLVGLVELWVARERSPYDTYTLIITFVALRFGARIGGIAALIVGLGAPLFLHAEALIRTWAALAISLGAGFFVRRALPTERNSLSCFLAITLAEAGAIMARSLLHSQSEIAFSAQLAVLKVGANGLGALLLQMVLSDAEARQRSEALRLEVERSRTRLAESQLAALQARVHPHFLFNALTSIAALCRLAPLKAEKAVVQLGQLMRRTLESAPRSLTPLRDELDAVTGYLELEALRLGRRLCVEQEIAPECLGTLVPPFALQTLVENAILHGIGPRLEPAVLRIQIARCKCGTLICVADSGVGMEPERLVHARSAWSAESGGRPHGLQIANEQLVLLLGGSARLRLFSKTNKGTLAVFMVPQ